MRWIATEIRDRKEVGGSGGEGEAEERQKNEGWAAKYGAEVDHCGRVSSASRGLEYPVWK